MQAMARMASVVSSTLPARRRLIRDVRHHQMQPGTPMILRPSPWKWAGVGAVCTAFTVIGGLMVRSGEAIGWLCLVPFGVGVLVSVASVLPNATYLKLDPEGFTMCSMYRSHTFRWEDVSGFEVGSVFSNKMVLFNFEPSYTRTPGLRSLNVGLVGFEAGLPGSYGLKHEELADLLNKFKQASHGA